MAQKADCTLRSGLFGQSGGGDCGCWRCFVLVVFFVGRVCSWVCSCGGYLSCGAVCRCVLGTEAVIFLLAAAFRVMFRAMPFSFLSLEAFGAGNALLFSGIRRIRYRRGPPTVRNMRAVLKKVLRQISCCQVKQVWKILIQRSRSEARPYILLLIYFILLFRPSISPLLIEYFMAFLMGEMSRWTLFTKLTTSP